MEGATPPVFFPSLQSFTSKIVTLLQKLNHILIAAAYPLALRRANKANPSPTGKKITQVNAGVLIACYNIINQDKKANPRTIWNSYKGVSFGMNYSTMNNSLAFLCDAGMMQQHLYVYQNRTFSHYTLTFTGINFLHDLEKHLKKCSKPR